MGLTRNEVIEKFDQKKKYSGVDAPTVEYNSVGDKVIYAEDHLHGTDAQSSTAYGVFWIAPEDCYLRRYQVVWGTAASAGTITIEKLADGVAQNSGTAMLRNGVSLTGGANKTVVREGTSIVSDVEDRQLARNDRVAHNVVGSLASAEDVTVKVEFITNR